MSPPPPRQASRAAFAFVFVTVVLDMLALGVMVPVLPKLIVQLEGGDIASAAAVTGVFGFGWAAMQFAFAPVLGALSDRFGRRPVILLSNLGLGLDYLVMALAPTLRWLFLGRLISGITSSSFATAGAYISDVTPPEERAAKFGMLGAAFGLGFIVGPAVGGLLGAIDLRLPFWAAAGLSLLNAAYGFFVLPESLPRERRTGMRWQVANPLGALWLLRSNRVLLGLASAIGLFFLAHEALPSTFVLYADYRYHWDERQVGIALAAVGICSTVVAATLIGPIVKWLGERRALLAALFCGAVAFAGGGLAPTGALFLLTIPVEALMGIASPAGQALMTRQVDDTRQGQLQGALSSLRGLTGMAGPLLFTQVFAFGLRKDHLLPGAAYLLGALLIFGSVWIAALALRGTSRAPGSDPQALSTNA